MSGDNSATTFARALDDLEVEDETVQGAAIEALRGLNGGVEEALRAELAERPLRGLTAVRALREATVSDMVAELMATSRDANVRAMAALTLGVAGGAAHVDALLAGLHDGVPAVRAQAAAALGAIGGKQAVAALKAAYAKETDAAAKVFIVDVLDAAGAL